MQKYSYKAKTSQGTLVKGLVEATSQDEALRLLHEKRLVVLSLKEKVKSSALDFVNQLKSISSKELSDMTRQLATMIGAGLTLLKALTILQDQANPKLAKVLDGMVRRIEGGSSFYNALKLYPDVFSNVYVSLVKSGEASGKLDQILNQLADTLEKGEGFKRKVKGALIYPAIIVAGMGAVAFIMMVYVIPKLTQMYEEMEAKLPLPTLILIGVSKFVSQFWYLFLLAFGGTVFAFWRWRQTKMGKELIDRLILKTPIVGKLVTKVILTDIMRTISMLILAGVPIIEALNIATEVSSNVIFERSLRMAAAAVEKGLPLTAALERFEEYPTIVIQMISVGEQTGKVGEVLVRVANYFEQESEAAIKGLTTAIEPLMMIVLGVGVAFIVMSVITPIYNLTSQF